MNDANAYLGFDTTVVDQITTIPIGTYTNGSLQDGLNLVNKGLGYKFYIQPGEVIDYSDWGTYELVTSIDEVGQQWFCFMRSDLPRVQVGDLSLFGGGYWPDHPGGTHQYYFYIFILASFFKF